MSLPSNRRGFLLLVLSASLLCHCGREESPVVGVLKTTTHEFTLHSGPDGPLYTVRDESGKGLVREVSSAILAAEYPVLNEDLKGLYAGNLPLTSPFPSWVTEGNHIGNAAFKAEPLDLKGLDLKKP